MKKFFLTSIAAVLFASLMLVSCGKDDDKTEFAQKYVGTYDLVTDGNVNVTIPLIGNQDMPLKEQTSVLTIALDGDEGGVIATVDGETIKGTADKDGLHLNQQHISMPYTIASASITVEITVNHPTIGFPNNGIMSWSAPLTGSASYMGATISGNGTANFVATKR